MRWTAKAKVAVIEAIRGGAERGSLAIYGISSEEFAEWERAYDSHGKEGLKATKLQGFRTAPRHTWVKRTHARSDGRKGHREQ